MEQKDILEFLNQIKEKLQVRFPENHEDYETLKALFKKKKELMEEIKKIDKDIDEIGRRFSEKENCIYDYKNATIDFYGRVFINYKLQPLGPYESSIGSLYERKYRDQNKPISYTNLNDLNSAKFLTDDEKREILGLKPLNKK